MVNTRILTREFDYHRPSSLEEAFELLAEYGDAAKVIAGGTDVVPQLKCEKIAPNHLITLQKISGLGDINEDNGVLSVGACARLDSGSGREGSPHARGGQLLEGVSPPRGPPRGLDVGAHPAGDVQAGRRLVQGVQPL